MYLETYSMEELMELIEEKGYCSVEAVEILKEMEQAKKEYDFLLRDCKEKAWKTDQVVVDYYRYLLEELRKALPYDAMGGQHTIPILVLQEFRKQDIVEKIRNFIGCQAGFSDHDLLQEIQKFITVHLDPQELSSIWMYWGISQWQGMLTNREDKCGKRKSIGGSGYKHFYCRTAGSDQKHHKKRLRRTRKRTSLPAGVGFEK
ncbi:hypothetical protein DW955_18380 [Ruminococcus sp. AM45-9BH]|uniref:Uncharacterized protein n=1 Tax=Anaerobutyricum hallii TaxID=39488 RepID=A0A374NGW1_9FIRM|nr:hypothetical protein DXD91_11355 [Anaerobutyricum hallii]RHS59129.1 hypothetical protein DW955_18380 [Ruminococcus sp. AM45-9BH]